LRPTFVVPAAIFPVLQHQNLELRSYESSFKLIIADRILEMTDSQIPAETQRPVQTALGAVDVQSHHGSLRSKLVLSLAGIFLIFLVIDEVVRRRVIQPEFVALEQAGAIRDANRVLAALNAEVEHLHGLTEQWAIRLGKNSDSAIKAQQTDPTEESRLAKHYDLAVIYLADDSWKWLDQGNLSPQEVQAQATSDQLHELVEACEASDHGVSSGMTGISADRVLIYAVVKIRSKADRSEYLIVGQHIDNGFVATLGRQTQVSFQVLPPRLDPHASGLHVWESDHSTLIVELQLTGLGSEPLANLAIQSPREITARAMRTASLARNTFIFGCVAALLVLLLMLQRIVVGPLTEMREYSDRVAEQGLDAKPLQLAGNDEIGHLAKAFDNMVQRLSDAQSQLAVASQATGRSEVASTVIHNVGNVLTNVNSLLDAATGRVQGLRISPLEKLAARLKEADADEALQKATPDYLAGLANSLKTEQQLIGGLLATLHDNVRHIHDVIRDQQRHASKSVQLMKVQLDDLIEDAIGCCRARLEQDAVAVTVTGTRRIELRSDRSLLLQILINVIGNARHAMAEMPGTRQLRINVQPNDNSVVIQVQDNGCGMNSETLAKVFTAHFTTKATGSGLGLHFCALTLKRLGGAIRASSDGLGQGSTFLIELPISSTTSTPIVINQLQPILATVEV
jgi:signal transduction histidine kinase